MKIREMDITNSRKINMGNPAMESRVKKYDTYQQRGHIDHRNNFAAKPVAAKSFPVASSQVVNNSSDTKVRQKSAVSDIRPKPKPQVSYVRNNQVHNTVSNTRKQFSSPVALQAVRQAQLYDNELYPDNEITIYSKSKRKLSLFQKTMYGFGVVVLLFSAFVSIQTFVNNKQAKEQIATLGENSSKDDQGVSEGTGDEPSEEAISESAINAYKPSNPEDPRYIRIPEIGVIARVKNLGITPEGAVDAPKNIFDAGWYNGSARPGNSVGSSLILAHVSGWTGPGIFKNINKLVEGSKFEIEKGNGEKIQYSVTRKEQLPVDQVNMSSVLSTETAGQHDIKLMTCSGKYNNQTKTFDDRYIVYAKQI